MNSRSASACTIERYPQKLRHCLGRRPKKRHRLQCKDMVRASNDSSFGVYHSIMSWPQISWRHALVCRTLDLWAGDTGSRKRIMLSPGFSQQCGRSHGARKALAKADNLPLIYGDPTNGTQEVAPWAPLAIGALADKECLAFSAAPDEAPGENHQPEAQRIPLVLQAAHGERPNIAVSDKKFILTGIQQDVP